MHLKKVRVLTSLIGLCAILIAAVPFAFNAQAVAFNGDGTQNSPYLVETAEQLDAIRNNLSAHYKLANTIDMSSVEKFTPIGGLSAGFTGSFTCDLADSGIPKFAIKNIKIYNDAGEKYGHAIGKNNYTDYKSKNSHWETGIFGYTDGAVITNIAVRNANITSTVVGQNQMGETTSIRYPGQDEQGTAVLIGMANNTTLTGCSVTGTVVSKSNCTGGLVGSAVGGAITTCYSQASVSSEGLWNTGGLIGACNTAVSNCFSSGSVKGGGKESVIGGLVGTIDQMEYLISNSYSTSQIQSSNGSSFAGYNNNSDTSWSVNCYASGAIQGVSGVSSVTETENNCYVLNVAGCSQRGFKAASSSEIKSAFSSISDWDVSGELPKLKNVIIIADDSQFAVNAVTAVVGKEQEVKTSTDTLSTASVSSKEVSAADVDTLIKRIDKLPAADSITIKDKTEIKEIKSMLDNLTPDLKALVPVESQTKFTQAYTAIIPLIIRNLVDEVEKLPAAKKLKSSDVDKVLELYDDFNFIPEEDRSVIASSVADKLEELYKSAKEIECGGEVNSSLSTSELILIIVLSTVILANVGLNVFISVKLFRKKTKI